jgi:hypothetical protein
LRHYRKTYLWFVTFTNQKQSIIEKRMGSTRTATTTPPTTTNSRMLFLSFFLTYIQMKIKGFLLLLCFLIDWIVF